jgi:type IV pilus assembly protein PilB
MGKNTDQKQEENISAFGLDKSRKMQEWEEKARAMGVSYLADEPKKIDKSDLNIIPEDSAVKYQMAIFEKKKNSVKVAMVNPQDFEALNVLRFIAEKDDLNMEMYLVSPENFQDIIDQYHTDDKVVAEALQSIGEDSVELDYKSKEKGDAKELFHDAPIAKLVHVIVKHAVEGRASDVHIEPVGSEYRVRFRVDGILHSSLVFPKAVGRAVVSRIKILSNLKIDEKRKPQDGRFQIDEEGKQIDFRVSTLPVLEGEKVVLRILDKENKTVDLESIGLVGRNYDILTRRIKDPFGVILITGPTGSGKSTTLYAFLQILNQIESNIITLEDPVEYFIAGINQSQIKPEIGFSFASGLRSILRQDPNVIMVGEIRDTETAELVIHAALTGHLVFSTVHTNDSIGTIPRLIDMGVESFLLASSLRAVAAQRLVRKICENCKAETEIPASEVERIKKEISDIPEDESQRYKVELKGELKFFQGKGCEECGNTGYKGRIAIFEALDVDKNLQEIISEKENCEANIRKYAKEKGMLTMRQDGILKVIKGITTLSEVERVTEGTMSVGGDVDDDKG